MPHLDLHPDEIAEQLRARGDAWADAEAAASMLEETRKTLRSTIAVEHLDGGESVAKATELAQADERYIEHVMEMVDARQAANRAKVAYQTMQAWMDMKRTQAATERVALSHNA